MTPAQIIKMNYEVYKTLGNLHSIMPECYGHLVALGKIDLTQDEMKDYHKKAEAYLFKNHQSNQITCDMITSERRRYAVAKIFNEWKQKEQA